MIQEIEASLPGDVEIVLSRVFDAPRELVWKVWTQAEHLANWWGPRGFSLTTHQREFKPGGVWRYVMHGPDGRDYENQTTFLEIVEPEMLSYKHGGAADVEPVSFQVTVKFELADGGKQTKVTMRSIFPNKQARDYVIRTYNAVEGGKQHLGRLAEYLDEVSRSPAPESSEAFVLTRVFRVPREKMWDMWTREEHLQQWFGPKERTISKSSLDLREGGRYHYCMRGADGSEMWALWTFRKIVRPESLEFLLSFADEQGNVIRAPWDAEWPLEMLVKATFAEHAGIGHGTVIKLEKCAYHANAAERQKFADHRDSMRQGWTGSLDRLEEFFGKA